MTGPRLILGTDGRITVARLSSEFTRSESDVRRLLTAHYGSIQAFALRFGFRPQSAYMALSNNGARCAGEAEMVRHVLGLPTSPSDRSKKQVAYHATKSRPTAPASAPERRVRQSARAGAAGPDAAPHDWHPADVKAALEKRGLDLSKLAKANGYSHFRRVLTTHWWAAEQIVAKALDTTPEKIWPSRYAEPRTRAQRMTRNISVDRRGRIRVEVRS